MKKFKNLILLVLALMWIGLGCEKESIPELTEKYLTVDDAKYKSGKLPTGKEDVITDVQINKSVINGGSAILIVSASEPLTQIYISVDGITGYYVYNVATSGLTYQILINLSQELDVETLVINVSAKTDEGAVSLVEDSGSIKVVEVGTGKLQVSLSWNKEDDVDLHLFEPDGDEICYENPASFIGDEKEFYFKFYVYLIEKYTSHDASSLKVDNEDDVELLLEYLAEIEDDIDIYEEFRGYNDNDFLGCLDLDSNADCEIDGVKNENITYSNPENGTYTVAIDLYSKCMSGVEGAKYSVTAVYNGKALSLTNPIGQFEDDNYGSGDSESQYVTIGKFTISGSSKSALLETVDQRPVNDKLLLLKQKLLNAKAARRK